MKGAHASIVLVVAITSITVTAAPIFTWQDEQGRIHYADRPLGGDDIQQTELDTRSPVAEKTERQKEIDNLYSIRKQIEYYDDRREAQRQAWLEKRRLIQSARELELQSQQLQQQAELAEAVQPPVPSTPRYYYHRYGQHPGYQPPTGIQINSPYALQLQHSGDRHRLNLNVGSPYPSYPLNFWKY